MSLRGCAAAAALACTLALVGCAGPSGSIGLPAAPVQPGEMNNYGYPISVGDYVLQDGFNFSSFACEVGSEVYIASDDMTDLSTFGLTYITLEAAEEVDELDGFCSSIWYRDAVGIFDIDGTQKTSADVAESEVSISIDGSDLALVDGVYCNAHEAGLTEGSPAEVFCATAAKDWVISILSQGDEQSMGNVRELLKAFVAGSFLNL